MFDPFSLPCFFFNKCRTILHLDQNKRRSLTEQRA